MKVTINNKETETQAKTIRELAQELDLPATGVAVAICNEMVPLMNGKTQSSQKEQTSLS